MIANAVPLDELEALNPARPPPPEEGRDPGVLDVEGDWVTGSLRRKLAGAKTLKQRANLDRRIRARAAKLTTDHQAVQQAHAEYQTALTEWRNSRALRDAPRWLQKTLTDLRARSGQHVADLFAARPEPVWQEATGLADLVNPIQMMRALNLAGKVKAAWDVMNGDLRGALHRLELYREWLALMQPLFPDDWSAPPVGVENAGLVATAAAVALNRVGLRREAAAQEVFAIQASIPSGPNTSLTIRLRNHSITLSNAGDVPGCERLVAVNQTDRVRDHALKGYEWAWANGPPYVRHRYLEECRAVLHALNEPEPQLPPFDPEKHKPFPWEADIHRMLEAHAAKKRAEAKDKPHGR